MWIAKNNNLIILAKDTEQELIQALKFMVYDIIEETDIEYQLYEGEYLTLEEIAIKEQERIAHLHLTRGDVFRGLLQARGVTRSQLRQIIENLPEENQEQAITKEMALIDFDEALEFYRGNALIETVGEMLGITSTFKAMSLAREAGLDLVEISPNSEPPVCRVMDYGKYRFDQQKREKEAKKNQKVIEIKEIQLTLNIDTHDIETKVNHAIRFLKAGNKVKVSLRFRGREMVHPERGLEIMQSFADACSEYGNVEKPAKLENRTMLMFLAAKTAKK